MPDDDDTIAPNCATPSSGKSNSSAVLADLAERAGKFYRRSSEDWFACANLLLEARKVCPHGEWSVFLEDAGIRQRTARRMLAFAMAGVQNGHVAVLGVRYVDRLIAVSRQTTAGAIELARADPHPMPWQKTPEEIAADEWELAGAYVQAVINVIPELSSEVLKRNGFDAATVRRAEAAAA